jgi:tetratricopeptide (TPR) repeat protein
MRQLASIVIWLILTNIFIGQSFTNGLSFLEKMLTAENILDKAEMSSLFNKYNSILLKVKKEVNSEKNIYDKHEVIFDMLHSMYFRKYTENPKLSSSLKMDAYNCVTAVSLYYSLCLDLNLIVNIYETPHHVYLTFPNINSVEVIIELTDPRDGFDFDNDKDDYINFLINYKLITQQELYEKGEAAIYNEYVSNSKKIDEKKLISIYYGNLISLELNNDNYHDAIVLANKSFSFFKDSSSVEQYKLIWDIHFVSLSNSLDELTKFVEEAIGFDHVSEELEKTLINTCGYCIVTHLKDGKFEVADSLYQKLTKSLVYTNMTDPVIKEIQKGINAEKIMRMNLLGEFEEAFTLAQSLFREYPDDYSIKEIYIRSAHGYMNTMYSGSNIDNITNILDTLLIDLPDVQSVKDIYVASIMQYIFSTGQNTINPKKSKSILLKTNRKIPNNKFIKEGLAHLYHDSAMAEIRNSDYEKAEKLLLEGLEFDPNNLRLKNELTMTRNLIKSGAR